MKHLSRSQPQHARRVSARLIVLVVCAGAGPATTQAQIYFQEQQAKLIPPVAHGQDSDRFGSVCLSGDVALIGAMNDDEKGTDAGAVYVYGRNGDGQWVPNDRIFADAPAAYDRFGSDSVIQDGFAFVGAWYDNHSGLQSAGSVFVFQWNGSNWVSVNDPIRANDARPDDHFGVGIAIQGDLLLIGASTGDDDGEGGTGVVDCGVVYVFERNAQGAWIQQDKFAAPVDECHSNDGFGADIGFDGDIAIIGAWLDDDGLGSMTDAGAAYLFRRHAVTGEFEFEHKFEASDQGPYDYFGEAVALQGDMALIGAHRWDEDDPERIDVGAVYIYRRDGMGEWNEVLPKLLAPDREPDDLFGTRLAIEDDMLMVGAIGDDEGAWTDCGSAYVFEWIDHDLDGVPDSMDACPGTIAGLDVDSSGCPPEALGDCDRDGDVDLLDFAVFVGCIDGPEVRPDCLCPLADDDQDGDTDLTDFAAMQRCFSGNGVPAVCRP